VQSQVQGEGPGGGRPQAPAWGLAEGQPQAQGEARGEARPPAQA
jgi:hypothetical protein